MKEQENELGECPRKGTALSAANPRASRCGFFAAIAFAGLTACSGGSYKSKSVVREIATTGDGCICNMWVELSVVTPWSGEIQSMWFECPCTTVIGDTAYWHFAQHPSN